MDVAGSWYVQIIQECHSDGFTLSLLLVSGSWSQALLGQVFENY